MGRCVPEGMLSFLVLKLVKFDGRVFIYWAVKLYSLTIDTATYNVASESRRDALGDL